MERDEKRTARWWIPPADQANGVPGIYEVAANGSTVAEVYEPWPGSKATDIFGTANTVYPILHGDAFGIGVTLVSGKLIDARSNLMAGRSNYKIRPWAAIEGLLLDQDHLHFTEVVLQIQGQEVWAGHESFRLSRIRKNGFPAALVYRPLRKHTGIVEGGTLSIEDRSIYGPGDFDTELKSRSCFHYKFRKPVALEVLSQRYIRPLLLLITLATGSDCGILSIDATCGSWNIAGEKHASQRWVKVRLGTSNNALSAPKSSDLLVSLTDMDWKKQARHVVDVSAEWEYPIELWATLVDPQFRWPMGRFGNAVQAAEALDRILFPAPPFLPNTELASRIDEILKTNKVNRKDRAKAKEGLIRPREVSLEQRLARLGGRVDTAMKDLIGDFPWAQKIARLRHVASHGLETSASLVTDVRAPQVATEVLLYLLECLFLERLGFDDKAILDLQKKRITHDGRKWVISRNIAELRAVV